MKRGHGGDIGRISARTGVAPDAILDFSASINPVGPPEWLRSVISASVSSVVHYPDPFASGLVEAVASRYGCAPENVLVGNGSTELLFMAPRAVGARRAVIPVPAYVDYENASAASGIEVVKVNTSEQSGFEPASALEGFKFQNGDLVFIGRPSNPSGAICDVNSVTLMADANPGAFFLVDEAFMDFVENRESVISSLRPNMAALLSFTKIFAVPGLRIGAIVSEKSVIEKLRSLQPCWTVNAIAQAVGKAAMEDEKYVRESIEYVSASRGELRDGLAAIKGIKVFKGAANYLLCKIENGNAEKLYEALLKENIAIRRCANFDGLDESYFRVAVRTKEENDRLVDSIRRFTGGPPKTATKKKKPAIMFQGTCSNAGKSILTAAMCRTLLRDGYSVAPFKSQNMALNSFVTRGGGEMGRAQVVQAQACRLEPDTRMNPILLKPNTDTGSQVIVNGKPVGNMNVAEYIKYKPVAFAAAKEAYDSLSDEYDVIVLEGAGSPGEVNLKSHDIVNMNMAKYAGAPVALVGDIDRGGVYASFIGTMEVLTEWERAMVAGFIVNKFRGDASLLADAHDYVLRATGKKTIGVLPYLRKLGLPEEDSVGFKGGIYKRNAGAKDVKIAVVDLPHISNFTDIDPFMDEPDVEIVIAASPEDLAGADAIIIPGSKNVIGDVEVLKSGGAGAKIVEMAGNGTLVVGICAGLQIMGMEVDDPHRIESNDGRKVRALELLPVSSVLEKEKTLLRVEAKHVASGLTVHGYEIHHGKMRGAGETCVRRSDGESIGVTDKDGRHWGAYLHGIFDDDAFRRWFIDDLRVRKGLEPVGKVVSRYDLEPALERLADEFEKNVDKKYMYEKMGLK